MFVADSGSTSHRINSLKFMTNLQELKMVVKTGNKKTMMVSLRDGWKGYQKIDGKFYLVTFTDTAYIPYLSVNVFRMNRSLTKGSNMKSEKEILSLKKNATILKFEERLDHGNCDGCLLVTRLYAIPNDSGKLTRKGIIRKGKFPRRQKGRQRLQQTRQPNARQ